MKKLLVLLLGASALLAACSSTSAPAQTPVVHSATVVLTTCEDLQGFVEDNRDQIKQAFANNDAYTIGALELQNRAVIQSNLDCFPKIKERIEKVNSSGSM